MGQASESTYHRNCSCSLPFFHKLAVRILNCLHASSDDIKDGNKGFMLFALLFLFRGLEWWLSLFDR